MTKTNENFSMKDPRNQTEKDIEYSKRMEQYFTNSLGTNMDKLRNFAKFVPREKLGMFLAKNEIFKRITNTHGYIIECGVFLGHGLMTWAQLSGFDTFEGFVKLHEKDNADNPDFAIKGGLASHALEDLKECIQLYDLSRHIGHIPRVQLVGGDATKTIPKYVKDNPHLVVALLYLDFDLYEPTKVAIEQFLPLMPKGSVIAFDELNQSSWPGETQAVLETIGLRKLRLERFPYTTGLSYAVLE